MEEERETRSKTGKEDLERTLRSEDLLFSHYLHEEDRPAMRRSIFIAVLLHLFVISVTIPDVSFPQLSRTKKPVIYVRRYRPPPPPRKQRPEKPKVEKVITKKVPIPDPTPDDPEPIVEPEPEPEIEDIPLDVDVLIGAPEPPPMTDGILFAGVGGVTNPEKIHAPHPEYPDIARKAKLSGDVILQAVIRADGTVGDVAVLKSPGAKFGFDEEAIKAVKEWRWKPALQNGKPVDVYFTVIVHFVLVD